MTKKKNPSKEKVTKKEKSSKGKRKVDPEATASSGDEEIRKASDIPHKERLKRFQLKSIRKRYTSTSIFKGVRRTTSGKYNVEIRNPVDKITECRGTYEKEVEACLAYERRFKQFQRMKLKISKAKKEQEEEEEEEDEAFLDVDRSCKEQGKGFGGGRNKDGDDPSDDDDDDNDNIGGGASNPNVILNTAVAAV